MGRFDAWKERAGAFRRAVEALAAEAGLTGHPAWTVVYKIHQGRLMPGVGVGAMPAAPGAEAMLRKLAPLVQALIEGGRLRYGRLAVELVAGRLAAVHVTHRIAAGEDDRLGRLLDPGEDDA